MPVAEKHRVYLVYWDSSMFLRQNIEIIGTVLHLRDLGELLQRDSSVKELLGRGFLTLIADFSKESLSQSSSKAISLSRRHWEELFCCSVCRGDKINALVSPGHASKLHVCSNRFVYIYIYIYIYMWVYECLGSWGFAQA